MKTTYSHILVITMLFFGFVRGCDKENIFLERNYPRVDIIEPMAQNQAGVTLEGVFRAEKDDILDKGFVWTTSAVPVLGNSPDISLGVGYGDGSFSVQLSEEFETGMRYYVRSYAKTEELLIYSRVISFVRD